MYCSASQLLAPLFPYHSLSILFVSCSYSKGNIGVYLWSALNVVRDDALRAGWAGAQVYPYSEAVG